MARGYKDGNAGLMAKMLLREQMAGYWPTQKQGETKSRSLATILSSELAAEVNILQKLRSIFSGALIFTLFWVILLTAAQVRAAVVEYTSRDAYEAAGTYVIENWDEASISTPIGNGDTVNGIKYNYIPYPSELGYTERTNVTFMVTSEYASTTGPKTLGLTPTTSYPNCFTYDGVEFTFSQAIRSFGIDISTDAPDNKTFKAVTDEGDVAYSVFDTFPEYSAGQFLGFTSDKPFYSVTITYNLGDPYIHLIDNDNLAYGWTLDTMQVPLPPSLLLLGSGLAGLGLLRFRKRFKA
jgi:hypothetical protein